MLIWEVATAFLVGLTVIIRLVTVQVKLYLNCELELSLAIAQNLLQIYLNCTKLMKITSNQINNLTQTTPKQIIRFETKQSKTNAI